MQNLLGSEAFTARRGFPLGPMPPLRLERAPLLTPEYRGQTPRATLYRIRSRQVALLRHHEAAIARPTLTVLDATTEREPSQLRWTMASLLIIVLAVLGAIGVLV